MTDAYLAKSASAELTSGAPITLATRSNHAATWPVRMQPSDQQSIVGLVDDQKASHFERRGLGGLGKLGGDILDVGQGLGKPQDTLQSEAFASLRASSTTSSARLPT